MTINCKGKLIDLSTPKVMGILNVTPDSFYDGGRYVKRDVFLSHVEQMLSEGATFIDIGGYSSKPGAAEITLQEELQRIAPVINSVVSHFPEAILSVDTFRSEVATQCVEMGASMVNDISAGNLDEKMFETIGNLKVPYIMMHMRGTSQTMQQRTNYEDIVKETMLYFSEKIKKARSFGISDLVIDPGFGFAKTLEQNFEILEKLNFLDIAGLPVLVGFSRKSMVYKPLETSASEALNGTTILNTIALMKGAKILRVHDVKEAVECVKLFNKMNKE